MNISDECRWCGYAKPKPKGQFVLAGEDTVCSQCKATQHPTIGFNQADGSQVNVWYNPDNSLFIEFQQQSGKTSRYTLSEALLLKAGVLKLSDTPLGGRK